MRRFPLLQDSGSDTKTDADNWRDKNVTAYARQKCNSFEIYRVAHRARLRRRAGMFWQ